jgi:hypothetical protein
MDLTVFFYCNNYIDASLFSPHLMAPRPKHLCGCGCTLYVTRAIELGHLTGKRSAVLAASTLSQNRLLLRSRKQASKLKLKLSSRRSPKRELIGRPAPVCQQFSTRKAPRPPSESPSGETGGEYNDFPASEAGPSGYTIDLGKSLSPQRSQTPETQDLPSHHSSPMRLLSDADGRDQYGLSTQRRSHRITERVERIGRVRWGTNHVQFIEREEREENDEEASIAGDLEDEEDGMGNDADELDDEDMPFAEPGQEGISVWDLLGDGFLKEVADLGKYLITNPRSKYLSDVSFRRETS